MGQAVDHLGSLPRGQSSRRTGCQYKVPVQIDDESVCGSGEKSTALSGNTKDIWARLLNKLLNVASVDNWDVKTAPLVDTNAKSDGLGSNGKHSRVVASENDATSGRDGCFDNTNDVRDRQAGEERPHGEVLESRGRRWELIAEGVILHVDADQVVQARSRETENARHFLGVKQVGGFVPVDPHASEIVTQQVVERVTGEEAQTVRDPVGLVRLLIVVGLGTLAKVANSLSALLISTRPDTESNTIESMAGILLKNERVVNAMWLTATSADFDVVGKASLEIINIIAHH